MNRRRVHLGDDEPRFAAVEGLERQEPSLHEVVLALFPFPVKLYHLPGTFDVFFGEGKEGVLMKFPAKPRGVDEAERLQGTPSWDLTQDGGRVRAAAAAPSPAASP